jgi:hypothetical protein
MDEDFEGMPPLVSVLGPLFSYDYPLLQFPQPVFTYNENGTITVIAMDYAPLNSSWIATDFFLDFVREADDNNIEETCKTLYDYAKGLDSIDVEVAEDAYDGISGEDFVNNEDAFIINETWSYPLKSETIETMFSKRMFRNPHHNEKIKRIVKIRIIKKIV